MSGNSRVTRMHQNAQYRTLNFRNSAGSLNPRALQNLPKVPGKVRERNKRGRLWERAERLVGRNEKGEGRK